MALYIDKEYVSKIRFKLERFSQKSPYLWNFRCPICGDSKKNKFKARGYIYRRADGLFYTCHNCHVSMNLNSFIKFLDSSIHSQYTLDTFYAEHGKKSSSIETKFDSPSERFDAIKIDLPTIQSLPENHPAKQYILNRKIPNNRLNDLYYAEDFKSFVEKLIPDTDQHLKEKEKRIVIPWWDEKNNLLGVQGRALQNSQVKYISVKLKDTFRKTFGLNTVNVSKSILVVEGPFDSLFLANAVASLDSNLEHVKKDIGKGDYIFIYDNEPRNKQIVNSMRRTIDHGEKIVIWPKKITKKDINDMVLAGIDPENIIKNNTYEGLRAKLEFDQWRI